MTSDLVMSFVYGAICLLMAGLGAATVTGINAAGRWAISRWFTR